jgi:hypothetical protein
MEEKMFLSRVAINAILILVFVVSVSVADQWEGPNTTTDTIYRSGKVGIGTSSIQDSADFEVYDDGSDAEMLVHEDAGTNEARIHLRRGSRDWEIINNQDLSFEVEGEEKFNFSSDGVLSANQIKVTKRIDLGDDSSFRIYRINDFIRLRSLDKPYTILAIETDPSIQLGDQTLGKEAAISLNRGVEGDGNGRELLTLTNLDYGPESHMMRMSIVKSGTGQLVPFVIRYWNQDTSLSMEAFKLNPKIQTDLERVDAEFTGHVGIGTDASDSYQLAVEGKIGAREIVVTTSSWADYVFDENYELRPLESVENYLKENKHLPGIPSGKEIEQNGLSMADMMAKQMAKIEELTLYMIEQNKQIGKIKEENERLKEQIKRVLTQ